MYSDIADVYDEIFPLNRSFLEFVVGYLDSPGKKVLDLGCGPGDYVNALTPPHEAVGIDSNAEMIRLAKMRNRGTFYQLSFTEMDRLEGGFDCIFCIGNSFSYLPTEAVDLFFEAVFHLLKPRGVFVLQVVNWDRYRLTGDGDFEVKTLSDGRTFHRFYEPAGNDAVLFKTAIHSGEAVVGAWSALLYPKCMADLVSSTGRSGLSVVGQYGDFEKKPFIPASSPAAVVLARKGAPSGDEEPS